MKHLIPVNGTRGVDKGTVCTCCCAGRGPASFWTAIVLDAILMPLLWPARRISSRVMSPKAADLL